MASERIPKTVTVVGVEKNNLKDGAFIGYVAKCPFCHKINKSAWIGTDECYVVKCKHRADWPAEMDGNKEGVAGEIEFVFASYRFSKPMKPRLSGYSLCLGMGRKKGV